MGSIYRRGQTWWILYYRNRRRYRESSRSRNISDARELLKIREGDAARNILPAPGRARFSALIELMMNDYLANNRKSTTNVGYKVENHLLPFFGHRRASRITDSDIHAYISLRQAENASNGTINRERSAFLRAMRLGKKRGLISAIPEWEKLKEAPPRRGFFTLEEFVKLCLYLDADIRPMVIFAYLTGWRKAEILGLQWRSVDWELLEVRLDPGATKNDEPRVFPMTGDMVELLQGQRKRTPPEVPHVFHRNGRPIKSFDDAWQKACRGAGLKGKHFHDLRRTAARNWARKFDREEVMAILGHKTDFMFRRYRIISRHDFDSMSAMRMLESSHISDDFSHSPGLLATDEQDDK